jgi:RNA polymerase sigma-70 factor (ECF subfamily)
MTSPPSPSDNELVRSAQNGKIEAFALLYERFLPLVYNRVRYTVPVDDIEDVAQDVFIAVIRSLRGFRGESKFSTWLRTLTNRRIAEFYRHRHGPEFELDEHLGLPENPSTTDDAIVLRQALRRLPDKYREIILLRFAENMHFTEIANLSGKSVDATKSLFRRAIAALGKQVKGNG